MSHFRGTDYDKQYPLMSRVCFRLYFVNYFVNQCLSRIDGSYDDFRQLAYRLVAFGEWFEVRRRYPDYSFAKAWRYVSCNAPELWEQSFSMSYRYDH